LKVKGRNSSITGSINVASPSIKVSIGFHLLKKRGMS